MKPIKNTDRRWWKDPARKKMVLEKTRVVKLLKKKYPDVSLFYKNHMQRVSLLKKLDAKARRESKGTRLSDEIRRTDKYYQWRESVLSRDGYICHACGFSYRKYGDEDRKKWDKHRQKYPLHVHHVIQFASIIRKNLLTTVEQAISCDELWNTGNGITLCVPCHKKTDNYCRRIEK